MAFIIAGVVVGVVGTVASSLSYYKYKTKREHALMKEILRIKGGLLTDIYSRDACDNVVNTFVTIAKELNIRVSLWADDREFNKIYMKYVENKLKYDETQKSNQ